MDEQTIDSDERHIPPSYPKLERKITQEMETAPDWRKVFQSLTSAEKAQLIATSFIVGAGSASAQVLFTMYLAHLFKVDFYPQRQEFADFNVAFTDSFHQLHESDKADIVSQGLRFHPQRTELHGSRAKDTVRMELESSSILETAHQVNGGLLADRIDRNKAFSFIATKSNQPGYSTIQLLQALASELKMYDTKDWYKQLEPNKRKKLRHLFEEIKTASPLTL